MARPAPPALSRKLRQASVAATEAELSSLLAISRVHHADALAPNPMNFGGSLADAALALKLPSTGALIDGQIKSGDNNRIAMEMLRGRENQVADDIGRVERTPKNHRRSLDDLVGAAGQSQRYREPKRLRGLEVDYQLDHLLDLQIGALRTPGTLRRRS